jgi:PAS domain S-box-containing protein
LIDSTSDAIIVLDDNERIVSTNHAAESLFGVAKSEIVNGAFTDLFAPDTRRVLLAYLDQLGGEHSDNMTIARDIVARTHAGTPLHLSMTMRRGVDAGSTYHVIFRDITERTKEADALHQAQHQVARAATEKTEVLARISRDIRTPLNSIVGFAEIMLEERFGPIGNERYRDYLKDIRTSGTHLLALVNDLLSLSKIESGKFELAFSAMKLNELVQACVVAMQPEAYRERIIIRSSLASGLPLVLADARALRQIVLNMLHNSIKFTSAGGQVIISTTSSDSGGVVIRVRDTGIGMSETDLAAALEPFRDATTCARWDTAGNNLSLSLTKALVEANHATFQIASRIDEGTLIEITFPASRVVPE